jgi:hypothetical protein
MSQEFYEFAARVIDDQVAEVRADVASGRRQLARDEVLAVLDQLISDRAKLRAFTERAKAIVQ